MRKKIGIAAILALAACEAQAPRDEVAPQRATAAASARPLSWDGIGRCNIGLPAVPAPVQAVVMRDEYYGSETDAMSRALDGYAAAISALGAAAFTSDPAEARLRDALLSWARADAMRWPANWNSGDHSGPATVYFTIHTMLPAAVAYGEHRDAFSAAEQAEIEGWMKRVVDRGGSNSWMREWRLDNKKYLYGALSMAFGIAADQPSYINRGADIYRTAIRGLRPDGSLPGDSGRGGSAIHYTNAAIASLIVTAEMAAGRGIDLYGYRPGGRSIHSAIDFLLDATENPSVIVPYARAETGAGFRGYSATNQRRTWVRQPDAAWGYYYLKRFAGTPTAERLRAMSPFLRRGDNSSSPIAGGVPLCLA